MTDQGRAGIAQPVDGQDRIRSLWIPLREINLLLPNLAVAEIGSYRVPEACPGMPEWLLGMVKWRQWTIPAISLESLCGLDTVSNPVFSRLMVVNSVRPASAVQHYAIVTAGLPGLIQFDAGMVDDVEACTEDGLHCVLRIGNEYAFIPDLDHVQGQLERHLDKAA
jgi:chemosensory pili system protein ChpC